MVLVRVVDSAAIVERVGAEPGCRCPTDQTALVLSGAFRGAGPPAKRARQPEHYSRSDGVGETRAARRPGEHLALDERPHQSSATLAGRKRRAGVGGARGNLRLEIGDTQPPVADLRDDRLAIVEQHRSDDAGEADRDSNGNNLVEQMSREATKAEREGAT